MDGGSFVQSVKENVDFFALYLRTKIRQVLKGTTALEVFEACCEIIENSYLLKFLLRLILLNSIIPAVAFLSFAVLTFVTTFTGFLLIEGALLIFGACATILWFGLIGVLFLLAVTSILVFYFSLKNIRNLVLKIEQFYFSHISESMDDDMVVVENNHED